MATALSFYQIRTLPFASAIAIPILGAWLAEIRARSIARTTNPREARLSGRHRISWRRSRSPTSSIGLRAVDVLAYVSDGRIKPRESAEAAGGAGEGAD